MAIDCIATIFLYVLWILSNSRKHGARFKPPAPNAFDCRLDANNEPHQAHAGDTPQPAWPRSAAVTRTLAARTYSGFLQYFTMMQTNPKNQGAASERRVTQINPSA